MLQYSSDFLYSSGTSPTAATAIISLPGRATKRGMIMQHLPCTVVSGTGKAHRRAPLRHWLRVLPDCRCLLSLSYPAVLYNWTGINGNVPGHCARKRDTKLVAATAHPQSDGRMRRIAGMVDKCAPAPGHDGDARPCAMAPRWPFRPWSCQRPTWPGRRPLRPVRRIPCLPVRTVTFGTAMAQLRSNARPR